MDPLVVSYSSQIHLELPPREGVAALPYAEILNPMGEYFAEAAVRPDTEACPYADLSDCDGRVTQLTFTWARYTNSKVLLDTKATCHTHISDKREALLPTVGNSVTFLRHGIHP